MAIKLLLAAVLGLLLPAAAWAQCNQTTYPNPAGGLLFGNCVLAVNPVSTDTAVGWQAANATGAQTRAFQLGQITGGGFAGVFSSLRLPGTSSGGTTFTAPASGSSIAITLPSVAGTTGQVLTHGAGDVLAWATLNILDTLITNPTNNQVLNYSTGLSKWVNGSNMVASNGVAGSEVVITAGNGSAGVGGSVVATAGDGTAQGGWFQGLAGNSAAGDGGTVSLGAGASGSANGGPMEIYTGVSATGNGGALTIETGAASAGSGHSGDLLIKTGQAAGGRAGNVNMWAGSSTTSDGGNLQLISGDGGGASGLPGDMTLATGSSATNGGTFLVNTGTGGTADGGWMNFFAGNSASGDGGTIRFFTGTSDTSAGGDLLVTLGAATAGAGNGGHSRLTSGNSVGGTGGYQQFTTGNGAIGGNFTVDLGSGSAGHGGNFEVSAGTGSTTGGNVILTAGDASSGAGGNVELQMGDSSSGLGGTFLLRAGAGTTGGGPVSILGGNATAGNTNGGDIILAPGLKNGAGRNGQFLFQTLPTTDPAVTDAAWNDRGVVTLSSAASPAARLNVVQSFTKAQRGTPVVLSLSGATATPNYDNGNNFSLLLVHASCPCTLANPSTTPVAGQAGQIVVTQSATGSDTLAYGNQFKFTGGVAPVLSTGANAVDILSYYVSDATHINVTSVLNFQ